MKKRYFLLIFTLILTGCGIQEREKLVQKKEKELAQKEQELITREVALQLKEASLAKKQHQIDSTQTDSAAINSNITGLWNVRMVCVETTCTGSAIGDTKSETWDIFYQNNQVVAKAMTDNTVTRTYEGTYQDNLLELRDNIEVSSQTPATEIVVRLTPQNENSLEGQRQIIRSGDCRIVYSLQLEKDSPIPF
ncbi:hypothetical protein AHMF7616_00257 [Adhaeribacter pallidiroseus]|uniref:Uncharacterized protein n=2 Tax=Adhaeribacter pallidiroseus TaxID=2072847 RepID=A0A369QEK9_9BACT|nr:hypothetical protein AHMF7616_00257 [Adhaeribacter pallidiroseus]